jgi:hypothetical protein
VSRRECARRWEVEAAKDGRLTGDALDHLARHLSRCEACMSEARSLDGLSRRLRSLPEWTFDDVSIRRLKGEVLRRVDAELAGHRAASRLPWRTMLAVGLACALALIFVVRGSGRRALVPVEMSDPIVDVLESPGARWGSRTDGDVKRIDLESGTLRLHVVRREGQRGFVVGTPDGDIVDVGTRFSVTVEAGRTQRIEVEEGRVSLRLRSAMGVELKGGDAWGALQEKPPVAEPARTSDTPTLVAADARSPLPKARSRPRAPPEVPAAERDAMAEDASYLNVLTLLHAGRIADAQAAARTYLQDFPHGFRAPELERLVEARRP